jgi:hypothetical protein
MTVGLDGAIWTAGRDGVAQWNVDTGQYQRFQDGMPAWHAADILTDARGGIWVNWSDATYKGFGVSRYSEGQWVHYNTSNGLVHDSVIRMAAAGNGKVWFATEGGVSCFQDGQWTTYTSADGLPSDYVSLVAPGPGDVVWVNTSMGLATFDGDDWITYGTKDDLLAISECYVYDIITAPDGDVLFATSKHLCRYDGDAFECVQPEGGSSPYKSFVQTADGTVWSRGLVGLYAWHNGEWYSFLEDTGLPVRSVYGMFAARNGRLWLTTQGDGLLQLLECRFGTAGLAFASFEQYCMSGFGQVLTGHFSLQDMQADSCLNERYYLDTILQLQDDSLVFASPNELVVLAPNGDFKVISLPEPDAEPMLDPLPGDRVYGSDQSLWHLDSRNFLQFDGQVWRNLSEDNELFHLVDEAATAPDGRVWLLSKYALSVWDGETWAHWTQQEPDGSYKDLDLTDIDFYADDVYVSDKDRGLVRLIDGDLEDPQWEVLAMPGWSPNSNPLGGIQRFQFDSRGGIWAQGGYNLPAYYNGESWTLLPQDQFTKVTIQDMAVAPDDSLWLRFYDQVRRNVRESYFMRYDGEVWYPIGQGFDLPSTIPTQVLFTPEGDAWLSFLTFGVWHYDAQAETWEPFNTSNVFASSDSVRNMTLDDSGVLWFRLGDGYARYGPPQ